MTEPEIRKLIDPRDLPDYHERISTALTGKQVEPFEMRLIHPNGDRRITLTSGYEAECDTDGKPILLFGTVLDITELKRTEAALVKAEREYRALFNGMIDGFALHEIICNEQGQPVDYRYIAVNPAFERLTGYKAADIIGKTVLEIMPQTEPFWIEDYGKVALTGQPLYMENYAKSLDLYFEITAYRPSENQFACIFTDITKRKQTEAEHQRLEEQLMQSQKMESIGLLAGGVAHDFNNLLAVILGYGELLLRQLPAGSKQRSIASSIMEAGERAKLLTKQLLAFSRKQVLEVKDLNLNEAIHNIEKMIRRLLGEDITIHIRTKPDIGYIKADSSQLEQVILNLCVNARDAMPNGGTLTIETDSIVLDKHYTANHPEVKPGLYTMLSISDTGCGMEEEIRLKIFDPFFTTKNKGKGTGLGLSTAYGIVKQHGGEIWVYSEPGKGSTFKVYLPQIETVEAAVHRESQDIMILGNGETIYVVEDEESVRKLACEMLSHLGYTVIETQGADECLAMAAQAGNIDLLLTDVIMPGMNGRLLYEKMALLRPEIKVLYMSGYTDNVIAHHGILEEGIHFIPKPFSEKALSRKVHEAINQ